MELEFRINNFLALEEKTQLDSWKELLSIGNDFLSSKIIDIPLAKKIAMAMSYHRTLMGSSKAYEGATNIDVDFCETSLKIARIAFGKSDPLIEYLKSGLYYAQYRPERFIQKDLEKEINEILLNKTGK